MTAPALILVRHAAPEIAPDVPPQAWRLTDAGRTAARALAEQLVGLRPAAAVSSPEPKALETAEIIAARIGLPVEVDDGFAEHRRPALPFIGREDFEARMRAFFAAPDEPFLGGESGDQARSRFVAAIARHPQRPLLMGTHGTVLSLYVAATAGLEPYGFWRGLALPEAVVLGGDGRLLARLR